MSHFRFPRTARPIEQEMMNTVVSPNDILEDDPLSSSQSSTTLGQTGSSESSNSSVVSSADSSDSSTILAPRQPQRTIVEERRCWICFGDSSDSQGQWVKPCKCSLEAHQTCLLDWIAENQKDSPMKKVRILD
jgi:hypothetical protein